MLDREPQQSPPPSAGEGGPRVSEGRERGAPFPETSPPHPPAPRAPSPAAGGGFGSDQPFRTATGGLIDRRRPRDFTFDGKRLTGCHGDTLASALL
ncbi:(2Fe-2S)-binding protein, partial [Methylorubrum podarium]|uniref:(2Fe-2S)-binding protein n=1 Tax=Methylorubrum podarium TaxID=200476 RepID=UPI001EE20660